LHFQLDGLLDHQALESRLALRGDGMERTVVSRCGSRAFPRWPMMNDTSGRFGAWAAGASRRATGHSASAAFITRNPTSGYAWQ
jgi:hypothetical protein